MTRYDGQQYIYLFVLMIMLGFTGWYYAESPYDNDKLSSETLSHLPDFIIQEVSITQFNALGLPSHHFQTPLLTHFPYNNASQFISPRITLCPDKGEPWLIQADNGKSEKGTAIVTLFNHVKLHQNASTTNKNEQEKNITTTELTYYSKKDLAKTPAMIYFEEPGLRIQSLGMKANLKKQEITLLQQVRSEYVPQS